MRHYETSISAFYTFTPYTPLANLLVISKIIENIFWCWLNEEVLPFWYGDMMTFKASPPGLIQIKARPHFSANAKHTKPLTYLLKICKVLIHVIPLLIMLVYIIFDLPQILPILILQIISLKMIPLIYCFVFTPSLPPAFSFEYWSQVFRFVSSRLSRRVKSNHHAAFSNGRLFDLYDDISFHHFGLLWLRISIYSLWWFRYRLIRLTSN